MDRRTGPSEKALAKRIVTHLNRVAGCRAVKQAGGPYGRRGDPDIRGCFQGRAFYLEVKRPGGKATRLQQRELEKWAASGAVVAVVHNVGEAYEALGLMH